MNSALPYLAVFAGGGLGAVLRYGMGKALANQALFHDRTHWITFLINILASVALVLVYRSTVEKSTLQLFLAVGLCGGWSTFSTFSFETVQLIQQGRSIEALAYVLGSVLVAYVAILMLLK